MPVPEGIHALSEPIEPERILILKYTASRKTEDEILALIPNRVRDEVIDGLRADAWLGVIIRPEHKPRTGRDYHERE